MAGYESQTDLFKEIHWSYWLIRMISSKVGKSREVGKSGVEKFLLKLESANRSWKKQAKLKRTE